MTNDQKLTGPTCVVGDYTAAKVIFYRFIGKEYQVLLFRKDSSTLYCTLPGGKRESLDVGPYSTLARELREEMAENFNPDYLVQCHLSIPFKVRVFAYNMDHHPFEVELTDDIYQFCWKTLSDAEVLTNHFWKAETLKQYILEAETYYSICPVCGDIVCSQAVCATDYTLDENNNQVFYHSACYAEENMDPDDNYDDDCPCNDCDDSKMPYAERHCDECPHHCKESSVDSEIQLDDEDDWLLDMYGPKAVNARHGK